MIWRVTRRRGPAPAVLLVLMLALSCVGPTDGTDPVLQAAKGGPSGGGEPVVDAADPSEAPQDTTLDVRVLGSNFDRGSSVEFLLDEQPTAHIRTNGTTYRNSRELIANITVSQDAVTSAYDIAVTTSGGKKGIGIEKFTVRQKGQWQAPVLTVTMREGSGGTDAVRADDVVNSPYVGEAHIASNGNLMFWLSSNGSPRTVRVTTTAFDGVTTDRIYTNAHTNPGGDDASGLLGVAKGGYGTAAVEVELDTQGIVRYGRDCSGTFGNVVAATKAAVTRSLDGRTWVITGTTGVHCKPTTKGKPGFFQAGTAGPFQMTLVQVSP